MSEQSAVDHRRVVERLYREHEHLCWYYRVKLRRPVIDLTDNERILGSWDASLREIRLSVRLILQFPWDVVQEVLKHEMAHQYVTEVLKVADGHGRYFRLACDALRVACWARTADVQLEEAIVNRLEVVKDSETDRMLRKAEKLMALAASNNEHESLLAMQRLRELSARYGLDRYSSGVHEDCVHRIVYLRKKRLERYQSMIVSILNDFFFVRIIYTNYFDPQQGEEFRAMDLIGTPVNTSMAEYVYHFLEERVITLWREFQRSRPELAGRSSRASYCMGVLKGFHQKLEKQRLGGVEVWPSAAEEGIAGQTGALLRLDRQSQLDLDQYVQSRFPRLRNHGFARRGYDGTAFAAGQKDGRSIVLNKPIQRAGVGRFLLRG